MNSPLLRTYLDTILTFLPYSVEKRMKRRHVCAMARRECDRVFWPEVPQPLIAEAMPGCHLKGPDLDSISTEVIRSDLRNWLTTANTARLSSPAPGIKAGRAALIES